MLEYLSKIKMTRSWNICLNNECFYVQSDKYVYLAPEEINR